jgi:hypothetical protein
MSRYGAILTIFWAILSCSSAIREAPDGSYDLRSVRWGMTRAQVLASEKDEPVYKSLNRLLFATTVIDKRMMLEYHFGADQLYRARYILAEHHIVDNKYVADYRDIQSVLTAKYGKPSINESVWKEGASQREDLQPGVLIATGHLNLVSAWDTPKSRIVATLNGKEFKINCEVTYTSKTFQNLAEAHDATDPVLGGQGGELGGAFENEQLKKATQDF